jgi:hypothetical protein
MVNREFQRRLASVPAKVREKGAKWAINSAARFGTSLVHTFAFALAKLLCRLVCAFLAPSVNAISRRTFVVYYDLEKFPISYDILWFLVWSDIERRRKGKERLHCVFLPIEDHEGRVFPPGYDEVVDRISREWRFENICVSAVGLLPSNAEFTVCRSRDHAAGFSIFSGQSSPQTSYFTYHSPLSDIYRSVMAAVPQMGADWGLVAPLQGKRYIDAWLSARAKGRRLIVLTLREYGVDAERNSNVGEWLKFARQLDPSIYFPVFVRDTDHAADLDGVFGDVERFDEPAWNMGLRSALYEAAYMNLFVNSGPASLCILNPRTRYLLFKISVPGLHLASVETLRGMGFEPYTQPAVTTANQRWIWENDTVEVISREFDKMVRQIESEAEDVHG